MRAGVSTVQHTLTAEAASILKQAVSDAYKRGHAQATPLHVAATLLIAPTSPLRRACLRSQANPSQLPQCRALELCFNIALERLQAAQGPLPNGQPSYSNALVAALKRAQAHQRRGCPEQQQQPLLAVKVELEQLVISILDDPSVSRVMREAGFSSTDVKGRLEEMVSLMTSHHSVTHGLADPVRLPLGASPMDQIGFRLGGAPPSFLGGFPLPHHLSQLSSSSVTQDMNDLQLQRPHPSAIKPMFPKAAPTAKMAYGFEEVRQVMEIFARKTTRNPVLVGDSTARVDALVKDVIQQVERGTAPEQLHGAKVLSANMSLVTLIDASKEDLRSRFVDLNRTVQELLLGGGGVVLNVGNLQWLLQVRAPANQLTGFCPVQDAAHEIKELFNRYRDSNRFWLIGSATSQTYRSCLALYPGLDSRWGLHPVLIGTSILPGLSARLGHQEPGIDTLALSLCPSSGMALQLSLSSDVDGEKLTCCFECRKTFEKEAAFLRSQDDIKQPESPRSCSSSVETPSKAMGDPGHASAGGSQPVLPLWLQKALPEGCKAVLSSSSEVYDKPVPLATRLQELRNKLNKACKHVRSECSAGRVVENDRHHQSVLLPNQIFGNPPDRILSLLRENSSQSGISRVANSGTSVLNGRHNSCSFGSAPTVSSLQAAIGEQLLQSAHKDRLREDSLARCPLPANPVTVRCVEAAAPCMTPDVAQYRHPTRSLISSNPEALGQLCKALAKKVCRQPKIISIIASTVLQCRSGLGKRAGNGLSFKGDTWLLFLGYDRAGKRLMAEALAELVFGEQKKPVFLTFGTKQQDMGLPATWSLGLSSTPSRGKMPLDQLADAVRQNPSSLFFLEDVDQTDSSLRTSLQRAMMKGRLVDSSGRDVSFSSAIVVMTCSAGIDFTPDNVSANMEIRKENPLGVNDDTSQSVSAQEHWLVNKRKCSLEFEEDSKNGVSNRNSKRVNIGRALDLNLSLAVEDDEKVTPCESDLPVQDSYYGFGAKMPKLSDEDVVLEAQKQLGDMCNLVDAAVVFASL